MSLSIVVFMVTLVSPILARFECNPQPIGNEPYGKSRILLADCQDESEIQTLCNAPALFCSHSVLNYNGQPNDCQATADKLTKCIMDAKMQKNITKDPRKVSVSCTSNKFEVSGDSNCNVLDDFNTKFLGHPSSSTSVTTSITTTTTSSTTETVTVLTTTMIGPLRTVGGAAGGASPLMMMVLFCLLSTFVLLNTNK